MQSEKGNHIYVLQNIFYFDGRLGESEISLLCALVPRLVLWFSIIHRHLSPLRAQPQTFLLLLTLPPSSTLRRSHISLFPAHALPFTDPIDHPQQHHFACRLTIHRWAGISTLLVSLERAIRYFAEIYHKRWLPLCCKSIPRWLPCNVSVVFRDTKLKSWRYIYICFSVRVLSGSKGEGLIT